MRRTSNGRRQTLRNARHLALEPLESRMCLTNPSPPPVVTPYNPSPPAAIPTPLIHAGDTISVGVLLSSPDPDENGEGEGVSIDSSGGYSQFVNDYNVPTILIFRAQKDLESLAYFLAGADGDESVEVTADVDPTGKKLFPEEKPVFSNTASKFGYASDFFYGLAGSLGITGLVTGIVLKPGSSSGSAPPASVASLAVGASSEIIAAAFSALSRRYSNIAQDPPDPNFTAIAPPNTPSLPPVSAGSGLTAAEADAVNTLLANLEQEIGVSGALYTTLNRVQGADDAGDESSREAQLQAAGRYERQLASLLGALPTLLTNFQGALQDAGFPPIQVTPDDIMNFEKQVAQNGLPADVVQTLTQLGEDTAGIDQIRRMLIVQDTKAAAGTFPTKLSDPAFLGALQSAAQSLSLGVAGFLEPGSDSGASHSDGITDVNRPTFIGTAAPGSTVRLFAQGLGQASPIPIGQATADGDGMWSITASTLADGKYTISAMAIAPSGLAGPMNTLSTLVIDTVGPRVTGATYDRKTGQVVLTFQDDRSGLDPTGLMSPANSVARIGRSPRSRALAVSGLHAMGTDTIAFTVSSRHGRRPRQIFLTVTSSGIHDVAGNALDGEFSGTLPSGDGHAGGDFRARLPFAARHPHPGSHPHPPHPRPLRPRR